ncbi:hypothetical protein F4556_000295 [Kitasatospora gansuensis]|uniref:Uncharacterized protein n=1 Tax=Kitasatospora gansuensis TaxID=258050 RepID=A0A7W7WFP1_9ACTN|nr:hypothetical protein [Kitasatospora gansuensis]MBB4944760.1 hypothetical protein [Kitasatospora gansuensis]
MSELAERTEDRVRPGRAAGERREFDRAEYVSGSALSFGECGCPMPDCPIRAGEGERLRLDWGLR